MLYDNTITLSDIIEKYDGVCDIKYKDKTLPLDLILEHDVNKPCESFNEEYSGCIDEILYDFILKNEKRLHKVKKSVKRKPIKLRMTLRRKL